MKVFKGKAFTSKEKIDGKDVLGNPASVVVCKNNLPSEKEMSKIAIEQAQPITVFVSRRGESEFDVRYYFPDGSNVNFCGHGTFVSSAIINKLFNLNDFRFFIGFRDEVIKIKVNEDGLISVQMPKYHIKLQNNLLNDVVFSKILKSLNLKKSDVVTIYKCEELGDYVIELKNVTKLYNSQPDFPYLSEQCLKLKCRTIMITSKSNFKDFDYAIRVFVPHFKLNEDVACGSANTHIAHFWHRKIGKKTMKSFYPFNDFKHKIGGIQYININYNSILLSGYSC